METLLTRDIQRLEKSSFHPYLILTYPSQHQNPKECCPQLPTPSLYLTCWCHPQDISPRSLILITTLALSAASTVWIVETLTTPALLPSHPHHFRKPSHDSNENRESRLDLLIPIHLEELFSVRKGKILSCSGQYYIDII